MEVPADFSLDELLAYLRQEPERAEGYYSTAEWAERFGVGNKRMLMLLRQAREAGILKVSREFRMSIDGVERPTPVYRFELDVENDAA